MYPWLPRGSRWATHGDLDRVLVRSAEFALGEKRAIVTLCDDGQVSEVAVAYQGVGVRVLYRGELMIPAAHHAQQRRVLPLFATSVAEMA
jgi:hypothetical protein